MKQERKIGLGIVYGIFFSLTCILLPLWILPKLYLIAQWMNLIDFSHTFEQYMGFIFSEDVPFVCFCVAPAGILIGVIASNHRYTIKRNFIVGGIIGFVMGFLIEEFLIMLALIPAGPRLKPYFMIVTVMTIGLAVVGAVTALTIRPSNEETFSNIKKQSWVKWSLIILGLFGVTIVVSVDLLLRNVPLAVWDTFTGGQQF